MKEKDVADGENPPLVSVLQTRYDLQKSYIRFYANSYQPTVSYLLNEKDDFLLPHNNEYWKVIFYQ